MPMWDGKFCDKSFKENKLPKKYVFIFIGGTSTTYEEFEEKAKKAEKGEDFLSRLFAKLEIQSINYDKDSFSDKSDESVKKVLDQKIKQRALLVNYHFVIKAAKIYNPCCEEPQLLEEQITGYKHITNALLYHPTFKHGARSIQLLSELFLYNIKLCKINEAPPMSILDLHVDNLDSFMTIYNRGITPLIDKEFGTYVVTKLLSLYFSEYVKKETKGISTILHPIVYICKIIKAIKNMKEYKKYKEGLKNKMKEFAKIMYDDGYLFSEKELDLSKIQMIPGETVNSIVQMLSEPSGMNKEAITNAIKRLPEKVSVYDYKYIERK